MRTRIALAACTLVWLAGSANAQPAATCKKTETQAECHTRLRCREDEELEQCQQRLRSAAGDNRGNDGRDDRGRDDRGRDDRGRDDRGDDRRGRDDRADRGDRRDRGRRGGGRRGNRRRGRGFEANKTFGLGLELGAPSGLNGKYFYADSRALDFGLGYSYSHYYYGDGIHLYVDHLWHPVSLASTPALELPLYIGVGGRFWEFEFCERIGGNVFCDRGSAFGVRVPIGLAFDFNNTPIDIFVQLVPVIDLVFGDYSNRFDERNHFGIDGSVGIRFWFK